MPQQPAGMTNEAGVILTIGCVANGEAFQNVMPLATNDNALGLDALCADAVAAFIALPLPDFLATLAIDAQVVFIQAVGMTPGRIPVRSSFALGTYPGTAGAHSAPTSVTALGLIYQDPDDLGIGAKRILSAKTFFSGIPTSQIVQNTVAAPLFGAIQTFVNDLQSGWPTIDDGAKSWYRVLDVPKPTTSTTAIKRLLQPEVRTGIYTQKRRLTPRAS